MQARSILRSKWFWIILVFLIYSSFGFFVAPWLGKGFLLQYIREDLGREASLEELRVNPYALSVTLRGFEMQEEAKGPFAGFEELYANFETTSLFRWALTFREIRLTAPYVRIERGRDERWNFSDLIPESSEEETEDEEGSMFRLLVKRLELASGELIFVDRTRPTAFEFSLKPLSLEIHDLNTLPQREGPYSFEASTADGEKLFWSGSLSINPVASEGEVKLSGLKARTLWRYMQDDLNFEVKGGTLKIATSYSVAFANGLLQLNTSKGSLSVRDLGIGGKGSEQEMLALPELTLAGTSFDLSRSHLHIPLVELRGADVRILRDREGVLDWMRLLPGEETPADKPDEQKKHQGESPSLHVAMDACLLKDFSVSFTDQTTEPAASLVADAMNVKISQFSSKPGSRFDLEASLRFAEKGNVSLKGTAGIIPPSLNGSLDVRRMPLPSFQPYLNSMAQLELVSGDLNINGELSYREQDDGPDFRYNGNASVASFSSQDRMVGERLVSWEFLDLKEVMIEAKPERVRIGTVEARAPFGRVLIAKDGSLNIQDALKQQEEAGPGTEKADKKKEKTEKEKPGEGVVPVEIGVVRIKGGSMDFQDLSLTPQVATGIQDLNGEIRGLSSRNLARADVDLKGKVGTYGTATISGKINPLSEDAFTDVNVDFRKIELTTFAPYSGKFAGYIIDKGKLFLDLNYKLSKRKLIGENKIVLDQLALGEETDSPHKVNLPVRLAIAILKDSNGVIDVDLPVRGNLDDPEFSFGGIIIKALFNLVTKLAASPFNLIGNLVGAEGETLSYAAFVLGKGDLDDQEREKILMLARALKQRPALRLEVRGRYDPMADGRVLREARLREKLLQQGYKQDEHTGMGPVKVLEKVFIDSFGKAERDALRSSHETMPQGPSESKKKKPVFNEEGYHRALHERLLEAQPLDDGELRQLAISRAMAVKNLLVETGAIEDARIFILESEAAESEEGGRVRTGLDLTGS